MMVEREGEKLWQGGRGETAERDGGENAEIEKGEETRAQGRVGETFGGERERDRVERRWRQEMLRL